MTGHCTRTLTNSCTMYYTFFAMQKRKYARTNKTIIKTKIRCGEQTYSGSQNDRRWTIETALETPRKESKRHAAKSKQKAVRARRKIHCNIKNDAPLDQTKKLQKNLLYIWNKRQPYLMPEIKMRSDLIVPKIYHREQVILIPALRSKKYAKRLI